MDVACFGLTGKVESAVNVTRINGCAKPVLARVRERDAFLEARETGDPDSWPEELVGEQGRVHRYVRNDRRRIHGPLPLTA